MTVPLCPSANSQCVNILSNPGRWTAKDAAERESEAAKEDVPVGVLTLPFVVNQAQPYD